MSAVGETFADVRLGEALELARSAAASDVHLGAGRPPVLRVDGRLQGTAAAELSPGEIEKIVKTTFSPDERAALDRIGDRTIAIHTAEAGRARVHAYRGHDGLALSIRLLPRDVPSLESLHLPNVIATFAQIANGLLLFAGPTGSGKTTSLAAFVDRIARTSERHVVTIEDPIEYVHRSERSIVTQREVGRDTPSFEAAVVGALRSDPDVIVIGEMRTPATIRAALTAAETGHLVVSTLHTSDAAATVARMVDCFEPQHRMDVRSQLAGVLVGVVCQRLVSRINGGRRVAVEIMVANDAVRHLIREGKVHQLPGVIQTHRALGMQTLAASLDELVAIGEIFPVRALSA
jgi:twitching motility protein PilT